MHMYTKYIYSSVYVYTNFSCMHEDGIERNRLDSLPVIKENCSVRPRKMSKDSYESSDDDDVTAEKYHDIPKSSSAVNVNNNSMDQIVTKETIIKPTISTTVEKAFNDRPSPNAIMKSITFGGIITCDYRMN
jgi:hypothetical protein